MRKIYKAELVMKGKRILYRAPTMYKNIFTHCEGLESKQDMLHTLENP